LVIYTNFILGMRSQNYA